MLPPKITLVLVLWPALFAAPQETSSINYEKRYRQLLQSDPAVREKIESGKTTKKQIMEWLKSESSRKETEATDWQKKYQQFLKNNPSIRKKVKNGEATREEVIEYLKLTSGIDEKKKKRQSGSKEGSCNNFDHEGYRELVQDKEKREYLLHVPKSYDSSQPCPLVINYHGFGDCASDYAANVGNILEFNAAATKNRFVVAYPQAAFREKGARYWEPGDNGKESILTNDRYFTKQMIADIRRTHNIDLHRVYAVGYSNGGMMAYDLACATPEFIAAIGIMSGVMLGTLDESVKPRTPVIHFHGIQDEVLPYNGSQHYTSVPRLIEGWRQHHEIPKSSRQRTLLNDGKVISDAYLDPKRHTGIVLYTINREHEKPGGHVWFSDKIEGVHPNQIMWNFLSQYRLRP